MVYNITNKNAIRKWRENNIEKSREITREQVKRCRAKWQSYKLEVKTLCAIQV